MTVRKLKSIDEHNDERRVAHSTARQHMTGIACPECGDEMMDTNPGVLMLSSPPKKYVHCPKCGYKRIVVA